MSLFLPSPQRNPVSQQRHRREVLWQIVIPFVLGIFGALILISLTLSGGAGTAPWASIALIWLSLPLICLALFFLAFVVMLILAVNWLLRHLPDYSFKAFHLTRRIHQRVREWDDRFVEPWMRYQTLKAKLNRAIRRPKEGIRTKGELTIEG